jgi:hypothetical protein
LNRKTIRLPLQLGTSAARSLSISGVIFVPAIALVVWASTNLSAAEFPWLENKRVATAVNCLVISLFVAGFFHLVKGLDHLPTDVLLGDETFKVKRTFSSEMPWRSVSEVTLRKVKGKHGWSSETTLVVRSDELGSIELAQTSEPVELRSLETVAEALRQYSAWNEKPAAAATRVELFSCVGCGATLVPTDELQVECSHCDVATRVPEHLRARVRQHAEASAGVHLEEVARMFASTRLGRTRLLMALGPGLVLGAWPCVMWLVQSGKTDGSALTTALMYAVVPLLAIPTYCALRLQLVDRIAIPAVLLTCAVAGPDTTCGNCLAPLPREPNAALVGCVYCGDENILDLDLRPRAAAVARSRELVFEALRRRHDERARWLRATRRTAWLIGMAVVLLALALRGV